MGIADGDPRISPSIYLPPGESIRSPDGNAQCFTKALPSGQNLYLQRGNDVMLLHTTGRNLGAAWAPNSKWLAVTDNDAAGENYIMVFDVTKKKPVAVGKTPFGESWTIKNWDVAHKKLVVQSYGSKDSGIAPHTEALNLK